MDDAVSEIVGEYAKQIEAQERAAQAKDAVVEAAMKWFPAYMDRSDGLHLVFLEMVKACAALDRARKGGE